jgi:flagellin
VTAPSTTATATANALSALTSITGAVSNLGSVQGIVGAGINKLNYAVSLAQSQITNFSVAQSNIRDANIAAEAANLTKAQVLQQASLAALAQANSAPQNLLSLLKA